MLRINTINTSYYKAYRIFGLPPKKRHQGFPDLLAMYPVGEYITITLIMEVKDAKGKLRASQIAVKKFLEKRGIKSILVRSLQEVKDLATKLLENHAIKTISS